MFGRNRNRLMLQAMIKLLTGIFIFMLSSVFLGGREWVGGSTSFLGSADRVISTSEFPVPKPSPSSVYLCFEKWALDFNAQVPSLAAHTWNEKAVKKKKYGFVGGIRIISMPSGGLYCSPDHFLGDSHTLAFSGINQLGTALTVITILLGIVTYSLRMFWEGNVQYDGMSSAESISVEVSRRCFSLAQIKLATHDFSEAFVIGQGGFGKVYKGLIPGFPNVVAMKRLDSSSRQGAVEFHAEIETLSKLHHIHLVSLIGYCNEGKEMILVYEYIPGGTLADNLYKNARKGMDCPSFTWEQRLRICIGAARGLDYLHTSSEFGVIHRDVKDTNILLDHSDFGLSKLEQTTKSKSYVSTKVKGTIGYVDPVYYTTHRLTRKSDVYSFGIVMLVVLSGKPALDTVNPLEPESVLSCFRECMENGDASKIIDPRLHGEISSNSLRKFMKTVENCLQQLPSSRPTMARVVSSLEEELEQHQKHISLTLMDSNFVNYPFLEHQGKIVEKVNFEKQADQNPVLTIKGESSRYSERVGKSVLGWPWKAVWNRGFTKQGSSKNYARKDDSKLASNLLQVEHLKHGLAANCMNVTYDELRTITNNFRQDGMLGEGRSAKVYKGFLPGYPRTGLHPIPVAIEVLTKDSAQGCKEWQDKAVFLGRLSHPNLVKLVGFCCEDEHRVLIHEYMAGGSVDKYLFSCTGFLPPLSWSARMKIAFGAAKGLAFLHHGLDTAVIFRDFRTSNILLDLDCNVKLTNFGMENDGPVGDTQGICRAVGQSTSSSDVYCYGVVVLELLMGRIVLNLKERHLIDWAMPSLRDKEKLVSIIDPRLEGDYPIKDVQKVGMLAYACLNADPQARPSMLDIEDLLEPLQGRA